METRAGDRLKALRKLTGMTREGFADFCEIPRNRYYNVEQMRVRMAEDEYAAVGEKFPEFLAWLAFEGPIRVSELKSSEQALVRAAAGVIESGQLPDIPTLKAKIKD